MTLCIAVDANNDIYVDSFGNLAMVTGIEATLQACEHAARTILGEMVLAVDQGLPYFEALWTGVPNIPQFEAALRAALLAVDGVTDVSALTVTRQGDVMNYAATIVTVYGTGGISG